MIQDWPLFKNIRVGVVMYVRLFVRPAILFLRLLFLAFSYFACLVLTYLLHGEESVLRS